MRRDLSSFIKNNNNKIFIIKIIFLLIKNNNNKYIYCYNSINQLQNIILIMIFHLLYIFTDYLKKKFFLLKPYLLIIKVTI